MTGPRPCPALRCWFHVGDRGDGSLTCVLDVEREMSQSEVALVLGVSKRNVQLQERDAREAFAAANTRTQLIRIRNLKRNA